MVTTARDRLPTDAMNWIPDGRHPLDWNGPTRRPFIEFRAEDLDTPVLDHLERVTRRDPARIAVTDPNTAVTYGQIWQGLSGLAELLQTETKPGELIGLLLPPTPMLPLALLACLAAGRPFVILDSQSPGNWLNQVLADARPALVIGCEAASGEFEIFAGGGRVMRLPCLPPRAQEGWRPAKPAPDDAACVLFTSGSTGRPKGIVNSQRGLLQRVRQSINAAHINAEDRFLTLAPLCTIVGVRDLLTALLAGASIHLLDPQRVGAREILNVIRAQRSTILFGFPALLRSIIPATGERAGADLRLVRVGGDTTLWSDIDRLRAWIQPEAFIQLIYAATEAPIMQWFVHPGLRGEETRIPIGYPLAGNRVAVIDDSDGPTPAGEIGELVVESPFVALGSWSEGRLSDARGSGSRAEAAPASTVSAATNVALANSPDSRPPVCRLFRTGDLVRLRPDGLLERLGRKDRQVKIRGTRVELEGVEAALRQHPRVRDVAALARTNPADGGAILIAYVSAGAGANASLLDELQSLMRSVPPAMRPARIHLTAGIPRLPNFKLDVRALAALDEATASATPAATATPDSSRPDPIERTVAHLWQKVLQMPIRRPDEDFFASGGDSLKAIALTRELERALGLEIPLTLINEAPTFAGLCRALRDRRTPVGPGRRRFPGRRGSATNANPYVPLVLLKAGAEPPPVFFIHGVGGNVAELFPVARCLPYAGPVFGIQARGLASNELPHTTVEAMAANYLREIKARQAQGPYYLCGYSFGGLVAFEIAQRLRESGDEVGLVALFDTMPSAITWPLRVWVSWARRRLAGVARGVLAATYPRAAPSQLPLVSAPTRHGSPPLPAAAEPGTLTGPAHAYSDKPAPPRFLQSAPSAVLKVAVSALMASAKYRPGFYPGELTLFVPSERDPTLPSPQAFWRKHAESVSVITTPGAHLTMLSPPHSGPTAASLARHLPGAQGADQPWVSRGDSTRHHASRPAPAQALTRRPYDLEQHGTRCAAKH